MTEEEERDIFVAADGTRIKLLPISLPGLLEVQYAVERRLRAEGLPLDPPTYTVTTAGGGTETYPHDPTTLQSDEDRQAWEAYQTARKRLQAEQATRIMEWVLLKGVAIEDAPQAWVEERQHFDLPVPETKRDRRTLYLSSEVTRTPADALHLVEIIIRLSAAGLPPEKIEAMEALFRSTASGHASEQAAPAAG